MTVHKSVNKAVSFFAVADKALVSTACVSKTQSPSCVNCPVKNIKSAHKMLLTD